MQEFVTTSNVKKKLINIDYSKSNQRKEKEAIIKERVHGATLLPGNHMQEGNSMNNETFTSCF